MGLQALWQLTDIATDQLADLGGVGHLSRFHKQGETGVK